MRDVWVYLAQTPLLWLAVTLTVYRGALWLSTRANNNPLLNPVLVAIATLVTLLTLTSTPYQTFFDGAQFVHFLLGPATVALAIPLYRAADRVRALAVPLTVGLVAGSLVAILSAAGIASLLGASPVVLRSLLPKSATTPVAMGVAEQIGGLPSLTAVLVVLTGITGAVVAQFLFKLPGLDDDAACGFGIGVAAHGIGTARALQLSAEAGAFAGLAMGLNAAVTTILVPAVVWLLGL